MEGKAKREKGGQERGQKHISFYSDPLGYYLGYILVKDQGICCTYINSVAKIHSYLSQPKI